MSIFRYLLRYFTRRRGRASLTLAGISVSISAIVLAYGLSGWVESHSSRSLSQVLGDAKVWVVPARGVKVDSETGLIVPQGWISEDTIQILQRPGVHLTRVIAGPISFAGRRVVLYGDEREHEPGLTVSSDLWSEFDREPRPVKIGGQDTSIGAERQSLAPRSIITSLATARRLLGIRDGASWLLSSSGTSITWARMVKDVQGIKVTGDPGSESDAQRAIVYLIEGTVARFDPFSFRTKFSALIINSALTTVFGITARLIFLLGVSLAITSSMVGLRERRDEIALFAVTGLESNVFLLFLAEACVTQIMCLLVGSGFGLVFLWLVLRNGLAIQIIAQALGFGAVYLPVLVVLSTIIPSQAVAKRRPVELVRGII